MVLYCTLETCTDQVSVPAFVSGAMENWGLIMYRETRHLVDPDYCGGYEIDRLTYTVAHENVHMVIYYLFP